MYELRRESVMREARARMSREFLPRSYDELLAVTRAEHPLNAVYRQTTTYWEMVYGMARHGIVHADFLVENNGEGLLILAKVHPHLERLRQDYSPRAFRNAEWIATQCDTGRVLFATFQARVAKQLGGS